ncbi:bifunctional metallophosphatase/5'-nucleotidase [Streptomyces alkaliterrae]|uniref:Bifunctional metallophosphatase/5'-nucleotidase n=1 Tax=Streptomyces alkaliterrae TaxID=2213162 RepID=A0A5P0YRT3_9ACTN|nr:bifunctional metallophosphatase/5'-nucleotidase [Streptomyces alkaliterrae]MBB1257612.1 bifunctional metallophosphatase/5'-nucleotidase [Streptomyces alkaliterrae]MQS02978.1 bifunctional metallophosphatase/5'-nucleotidase [Streptomyces alkaliterrae]
MPTSPARRRTTRLAVAATGLVAVAAMSAVSLPAAQASNSKAEKDATAQSAAKHGKHGKHGHTVDLQVLAINDFHGALEPPTGSGGRVTHQHPDGSTEAIDAGGVEYLATALRKARAGKARSVTVAAGDMVGATPMLSGLFHDEPTIEALNKVGMDVVGVGNHEFDEGAKELLRKQRGGCHPEDGCYADDRRFMGANFPILAANVVHEKTKKPLLAPYTVKNLKGVKVGFIGVTLEDTPGIVSGEGIKGLKFLDEADTINKYTKELKRKGVNAVVALIHEGGYPSSQAYNHNCDADGAGLSGPIVDIARRTDAGVDALVTGHTHQAYVCTVPDPKGNDRLVTSGASNGRLFTELTMSYDRRTKDIVRTSVRGVNKVVHRQQPKARDLTKLIGYWDKLAGPVANRPIGWIAEDIGQDRTIPESPLGDLVADSQLAYARTLDPKTELALMNPGGLRTDLVYKASGDEGDGVVTYGEAFEVQPFSNTVNLADLTGAQLLQILREQVSGPNEGAPKVLQVSAGFTYTLDLTRSGADRVVADSVRVNGEPLDLGRTYRVAMNSFLAGGGDGFPTFAQGTNPVVGGLDRDALEAYLTGNSSAANPLKAPAADRITVIR